MTGVSGLSAVRVMPFGSGYDARVLPTDPLAYYPLWETFGNIAYDHSGNGYDGVHVNTILGSPGIGDGRACPFFDGVAGFVNLVASGLPAAWNGAEFTVAFWARVFGAADWAPAVNRNMYNLTDAGFANLSNIVIVGAAVDRVLCLRRGGGVEEQMVEDPVGAPLGWVHWATTCSEANDRCRLYHDGAQIGVDQVGLGAWAGVPNNRFLIGANAPAPNNLWHGYLGHFVFYTRELAPAEVVNLARRP